MSPAVWAASGDSGFGRAVRCGVVDLFAFDDSKQTDPTREGMGPLVAAGGLHVPGDKVRELELALDSLCAEVGFPKGDEFKWSPAKGSWQRRKLLYEKRDHFNLRALALARDAGAQAMVVMADTTYRLAVPDARSHEEDVIIMLLERAQKCLRSAQAVVLFDRPGRDRKAETGFLSATLASLRVGTSYTKLDRLALAVSTDSKLSRLLQLADVVTSCTTSYVAGESRYSPKIFKEGVLPLLREDYLVRGGRGLKIHPDFRYRNLYYWLLDDEWFVRFQSGPKLPVRDSAYFSSPDVP